MVKIHVYGKLRRYAPDSRADRDSVIAVGPQPDETVESLLARVGIPVDEVYHVFFNGNLLATHNAIAPGLGFQQVRMNPFDWKLNVSVKDGDRLGLFGMDMALLAM